MATPLTKILMDRETDPPTYYVEIYGLSTETKPTRGVATGSKYFEIDTSKMYVFEATTEQWMEWGV